MIAKGLFLSLLISLFFLKTSKIFFKVTFLAPMKNQSLQIELLKKGIQKQ